MALRKVLSVAGAMVLTMAGILAGRASSNPKTVSKLYYTKGVPNSCTVITNCISSTILTTNGVSESQALMLTKGGVHAWPLYSTSNCGASHRVHFRG